jgi:hypothetical protein
MAGPALVIPLIAAYGPTLGAAAGAGGAALLGLATGRALNVFRSNVQPSRSNPQTGTQEIISSQQLLDISNPAAAYADQVLSAASSDDSFVDATANYLKAETELYITQPNIVSQGQAASLAVTREIASKYDYVAADEASGKLGVLADQTLANGGSLLVDVNGRNISFVNDVINKSVPFDNFGTVDLPLAVAGENTPVNVILPENTAIPLIVNQEIAANNLQLVAQTAITAKQYNAVNENGDQFIAGASTSVASGNFTIPDEFTSNEAGGQTIEIVGAPIVIASDIDIQIPTDLPADVILNFPSDARKATGYIEDSSANTGSITLEDARDNNQKIASASSEAAMQAAASNSTNGGTVDMPPSSTGSAPTNNSAASNASYKSQENKEYNVSTGGVSRNIAQRAARINPLHDYVNYTYKISMYAVPRTTINKIASGEISPGNEEGILASGELLISSGGAKSSSRSGLFGVDFYIDNVALTSVVGQGARSRGTDVIEFGFDIIEPYNTTLLPRLVGQSYKLTGKPDFAMMFFVMKIDFLGYNNAGQPKTIPKTSKFLPFQMISMDFEVNNRGTVYKIKAIPVSHAAQTILDNTIPFHMEISGGTVQEIFNGDVAVVTSNSAANQRTENSFDSNVRSGPKTYSKGVKQALDEGEKYLVRTKAQVFSNTYSFDFRDGIGDKKIVDPQVYRTQGFRMSDNKKPEELNPKNTKLDPSKNTVRVQAGSKITDLINNVLQVSDYYTGQFSTEKRPNKPLMFHKIIPLIKFGELDPKTNLYQRNVTYVVKPYTMFGNDKENFGQKAPTSPVKRYQWIYTGQNRDIIDFKLHYQMSFFELRNAADKAMVAQGDGEEANPLDGAGDDNSILDTGVFPRRVRPVYGIADQSNSAGTDRSIKTLKLAELFKKQFDSSGDLISLDLKIVGDPDLIQQDNILYGAAGDSNQLQYDSGSVNFRDHEVYFNLEFTNPISDYNDQTGLFNVTSQETNFFSGLFRIISVKSEFRGGKFTQSLENYRVRRQTDAQTSDTARTTANSSLPKAENANVNITLPPEIAGITEEDIKRQTALRDETADLLANTPQSTPDTPVELTVGTPLG